MIEALTDEQKAKLFLGIHEKDIEYGDWTEEVASSIARMESIQLTDAHWSVIRFLRDHYAQHGTSQHARVLSDALEAKFQIQGGLKYLYSLFPDGPVTQGARIAGVPVPADSSNDSFGSVS